MKNLKVIALVCLFAFISADSFGAGWFQHWRSDQQQRQLRKRARIVQHDQDPVGAPLDGGLLILLGAAGATYFGVRKKKKNAEI